MRTYSSSKKWAKRQSPTLIPTGPSQKLILTINPAELDSENDDDVVKIVDAKYLASYNWLARGKQTILVPGCPPRWVPPVHTHALKEDDGIYFRDKNASQYPTFPTEPAVRSIFCMHPDFEGQEIDVFACGNTMGSLISFIEGSEKTFRFVAAKVGNTLFLVRKENSPNETIPEVYGYGHSFLQAYTSWDRAFAGSDSHQRLVSYSLGGLKCVIRSESDGYLPRELDDDHPLKRPGGSGAASDNSDIASALTQTRVFTGTPSSISPGQGLTVLRAGEVVPQTAVFDLKTRSFRNTINMDEMFPRLWVNQTENFVIAYHNRGKFDTVQIEKVTTSVEDWEDANHDTLERLRELLTLLEVLAEEQENNKIEVRRLGTGNADVWTDASEHDVLPLDLKTKWLGNGE